MTVKVFVVHESRPERAYLVPERWVGHPILGVGLRRVDGDEVELDKAVVEVSAADHHHDQPAIVAETEKE